MDLDSGRTLLHYRLVDKIGGGGMGEVWRAVDTTLGREVAIKFLPAEFADDAERLARFEREAKVLASLNHPSIAAIFGLHEQDGRRFLAMELVPGEDLAKRLESGPLPLTEALEIAEQIAEGLEAAHEQGVIHRDLKPANVKITPDGKAKILDFGLAKALETAVRPAPGSDPSLSPTITSLGTVMGVILGTAAYMSPEQARGKGVDRRADIWAFGCVLYEMLSGRRPFAGETISDTLAAVLAKDPDPGAIPKTAPQKVRHLIDRCLEKDPKRRLRDIGDARLELSEVLADRTASGRVRLATDAEATAAPKRRFARGWIVGAAAAGVVLGFAIGASTLTHRGVAKPLHLDCAFPEDVITDGFTVTPDGSAIVTLGRPRTPPGDPPAPARIYVRRLGDYEMTALPGTEGTDGVLVRQDSRTLFFTVPAASNSPLRNIDEMPIDGSAPPVVARPFDATWNTAGLLEDGGALVLTSDREMVRLPAGGGPPGAPVKLDTGDDRGTLRLASRALPGDRGILLHSISYGERGWYYRVGVLDTKTAKVTFLLDDAGWPVYSSAGYLVFSRGDALLAVGFDPDAMKIEGRPVPLFSGLRTTFSFIPARFDLSHNGVLVYSRGGRTAESRGIGIVDRSGALVEATPERRSFQSVRSGAADGTRFVATITNGRALDEMWVGDLDRPGLRRLVSFPDADVFRPLLSPDGKRVAFVRSGRNAEDGIYLIDADAGAAPRLIVKTPREGDKTYVTAWTGDGRGLIVQRFSTDGRGDIAYAAIPSSPGDLSDLAPLLATPADEQAGDLSPDGRWLVYASDESGRAELNAVPFRDGRTAGSSVQLTSSGGREPHWATGGKEIWYRGLSDEEMALPVSTSPALSVGRPVVLYDRRKLNVVPAECLPGGRQIVLIQGKTEGEELRSCAVVLNFNRELAEKMKAAP